MRSEQKSWTACTSQPGAAASTTGILIQILVFTFFVSDIQCCGSASDPDPTFHFNADSDPTFYVNADPDSNFYFDVDANPALIKVMQIFNH